MIGFQIEDTDTQESSFHIPEKLADEVRKSGSVVLNTSALIEGKDVPNYVRETIFIFDKDYKPTLHSVTTWGGKTSEVLDVALDESSITLTDRNPNGSKYEVRNNGMEVVKDLKILPIGEETRFHTLSRVQNSVDGLKSRLTRHFAEKESDNLTQDKI